MGRIYVDFHNEPTRAVIAGRTFKFRSRAEYRFAQYLQLLVDLKECFAADPAEQYIGWDYETDDCRFYFADETTAPVRYTADFVAYTRSGAKHIYEVKGWLTSRDGTKYRRMAKHYPDVKLFLVLTQRSKRRVHRRAIAQKYVERIIYLSELLAGPVRGLIK